MDYPRDNAFTFLFSTYKRTAGIAFAAILIIAIPVTLGLLNKQQDVRQRAQVADTSCTTSADCGRGFTCQETGTTNSVPPNPIMTCVADSTARIGEACTALSDGTSDTCPVGSTCGNFSACTNSVPGSCSGTCQTSTTTPDPTSVACTLKPACVDDPINPCRIAIPAGGWCPTSCTSDTSCPAGYVCQKSGVMDAGGTCFPNASPTLTPANEPGAAAASIFDLNDDGKLNDVDFNILYYNFSRRQGD